MSSDCIEFLKTIGPIIIGLAAIFASFHYNKRMLKLKKNEDEIDDINRKLSEFYGPLQQYLNKSSKLYEKFIYGKPEDFRTLTALIKGVKFEGNDKVLLEEIINVGKKVEDLLLSKSGLIDDDKLRNDIIPRLGKHILLLRLIYDGTIKGEYERFKDETFPREVDTEIERRIAELQKKKDNLKL